MSSHNNGKSKTHGPRVHQEPDNHEIVMLDDQRYMEIESPESVMYRSNTAQQQLLPESHSSVERSGRSNTQTDDGNNVSFQSGTRGASRHTRLNNTPVLTSGSSSTMMSSDNETSNDTMMQTERRRQDRVSRRIPQDKMDSAITIGKIPPHKQPDITKDGNGDPQERMLKPESSDETEELRKVYFNYVYENEKFDKFTNVIVTSKYTIFTFVPKFLFESFTKVANFFFLVVCVLQSIPAVSNTYGIPTNAPVLMFVITIDALFAIMEDRRRHQSDDEANAAKCHVIKPSGHGIQDTVWSNVKVGDFLKIMNREVIPADILILSVAEPAGEPISGICYVETKSLDGETNLKLRQAIPNTMDTVRSEDDLYRLQGVVECEQPNPSIHTFSGNVVVYARENAGQSMEALPISDKNILLRGCILRNTEWVYGIVLNTGSHTKIMQSASAAPTKWSDVMLRINKMIGIMCLLLIMACTVAATVYVVFQPDLVEKSWYITLENEDEPQSLFFSFIQMLFYYFLLLYQVIPISLYVSMTSVKYLQARFMAWDRDMYHEETDTPAIVRTMELNEELGQISYVFSDKTGTLTCNVMEFRKCSINGTSYGSGTTEIGRAALIRAGKPIPEAPKLDPNIRSMPYVNFVDPGLFHTLDGENGREEQAKVALFFEHLAVCHTVIPEKLENGEIRLSASSPDEQALVAGASYIGFKFENRSVGRVMCSIMGKRTAFDILEVLEFNSTRKRMSVVVRRPSGELLLYTKGADMMVFARLKKNHQEELKKETLKHMEQYAQDGLRTLAIAMKKLDEDWFQQWRKRFSSAQGNVTELEKRKNHQPNAIDDLMEEIEIDLDLLGATAIEDKLQEGVPQCLDRLTTAGIKVWMLTGDKEETAINISYACSLLDNTIEQIVVNKTMCPTPSSIKGYLDDAAFQYQQKLINDNSLEMGLIIDGETLEWALQPSNMPTLLKFCQLCRAVICNRVSPAQKADMVRLVRNNIDGVRTLAIGDGANDVAMIQAAHVGVGISGQEGMQAVNASDYAIAQFRFLERLLLVHGRWNYKRISKVVLYMFYKNITLVLVQYWYTYLSYASGSKMYWEIGVQVYNVAFTGLPIVVVGVLDKDLPDYVSLDFPELYKRGLNRTDFNFFTFFRWIGAAIFESLIIFFVMTFGYNATESDVREGSESRVEFGMFSFSMTVLVVNLKICLLAESWTILSFSCWALSISSWFAFAILGTESSFFSKIKIGFDEYGAFLPTAYSFGYILLLVIGIVMALLRHFTWNQCLRHFYPDKCQKLQMRLKYQGLRPNATGSSNRRISIHQMEEQINLSMCLTDDNFPSQNYRNNPRHHTSQETVFESSSNVPGSLISSGSLNFQSSGDGTMNLNESYVQSMSVFAGDENNDSPPILEKIPHLHKQYSSNSLFSNHGYAFSCDEETTMYESFLASQGGHERQRSDTAYRSYLSSKNPSFASEHSASQFGHNSSSNISRSSEEMNL